MKRSRMKLFCILLLCLYLYCSVFLRAEIQQQVQIAQVKPQEKRSPRVKVKVPESAQAKLEKFGFVAVSQNYQHKLAWLYRSYKHRHWPAIVTSDSVLHATHLAFNWYQRFLEIAYLRDDLINLTDACLHKMMEFADQYEEAYNDAALYNAAYFTIAKMLLTDSELDEAIPTPWRKKIQQELLLIKMAQEVCISPLFGYKEDYTQYKPRGHYARSISEP